MTEANAKAVANLETAVDRYVGAIDAVVAAKARYDAVCRKTQEMIASNPRGQAMYRKYREKGII